MKIFVFLLCSGIAFLVAYALPESDWAPYVPILISYHLFLFYLVATAKHEPGFSLPIFSSILSHIACLSLVLSLVMGRELIPCFRFVGYLIPALAPFECMWLFSGRKNKPVFMGDAIVGIPAAVKIDDAGTAQDYEDFVQLISTGHRPYSKPGRSLEEEYEHWIAARIKQRRRAHAKNLSANE